MAYCVLADVQVQVQRIPFTSSSQPSSTQVSGFIVDIEAIMNQRFKAVGIAAPITDAEAVAMLKSVAVNGVAAMAYRSINAESEIAKTFQDLFESAMENIEKNPNLLTTVDTGAPSTVGYNDKASESRLFKAGERQW